MVGQSHLEPLMSQMSLTNHYKPWKSWRTSFVISKSYTFLVFQASSLRMNVHQGSDADRLLQPEQSCLGDETLAATREKESRSLVSSGLHVLTFPLATRSEGTAMGIFSHSNIYPEGMQILNLSIYIVSSLAWLTFHSGSS